MDSVTQIEGLSYLLGINGYSYTFDASNPSWISGGDVKETLINLKAGIAYQF